MLSKQRRVIYLVSILILLILIILAAAYIMVKGPRKPIPGTGVTVVEKQAGTGKLVVNDQYDGIMNINEYDYPLNSYRTALFKEDENGILSFDGKRVVGINVTSKNGDIDWEKVKNSGVDFAMIRVGHRGYDGGTMVPDVKFEQNIQGATDAGIDVGVYYYSAAISVEEAEDEATEVISKISNYKVKYPVAFVWEFVQNPSEGKEIRTENMTPSEITSFADAFCKKVKKGGYKPAIFMNKEMAYEYFNLSKLKDYQIWYAEYRKAPSFYYDFKIWQYTNEGTVDGITGSVKMNIALTEYK